MPESRNDSRQCQSKLDRRQVMKMGVGAGLGATSGLSAFGQAAQTTPPSPLTQAPTQVQHWANIRESRELLSSKGPGYLTATTAGWVNNSGRAFGNGPMDLTSERLVEFVGEYSAARLTDSLVETVNYVMLDSVASMFTGFESEPARINARLSRAMRGDMQCTMWG